MALAWGALGPLLVARLCGPPAAAGPPGLGPAAATALGWIDLAVLLLWSAHRPNSAGSQLAARRLPTGSGRAGAGRAVGWLVLGGGLLGLGRAASGLWSGAALPPGGGRGLLLLALLAGLAAGAARAGRPGALAVTLLLALGQVLPESAQLALLPEQGGRGAWLAWGGLSLGTLVAGSVVGERVRAAWRSLRGTGAEAALAGAARLALVLAAATVAAGAARLEGRRARAEERVQLATPAGVLRYAPRQAARALEIAARAPALSEELRARLPLPTAAEPRLDLDFGREGGALRAGAGALAQRLALARVEAALGGRADQRAVATFAHGLATSLGLAVSGEDPFWYRYRVAVHWARGELDPDWLWDGEALADAGQEPLRAALGEAACAAISSCVGPQGPVELLAAWGRELDARPLASGRDACRQAWGRALGAIGLDPERLWSALIARLVQDREDPRARFPLPRLRAAIAAEDEPLGWIVFVEPDRPLPPGWTIVCRARWGPRDEPQVLQPSGWAGGSQTFFVRTPDLLRGPQIQAGLAAAGESALAAGIWESWASWNLPR